MSLAVCLSAATINYPREGGLMWIYLNWALGLREAGCEVIWLEGLSTKLSDVESERRVAALKVRLAPFGFADAVSVWFREDDSRRRRVDGCVPLEAAWDADLLLNLRYATPATVVSRFRRSAAVEIDPGLAQGWIAQGLLELPKHDVYFSIGETVGPADGIPWQYTPPCVSTAHWTPSAAVANATFTTVSHWTGAEWVGDPETGYLNDKRSGFEPYVDLPARTRAPLELALCLRQDEQDERAMLESKGWRVLDAWSTLPEPWDYERYIADSLGEFSCAKPSCVRLQNAWISDRTLCYLASGKPVVVQHTGASRFLPDDVGMWRFRTPEEAVRCLESVLSDYDRQCRFARALAEEYFDARAVATRVLERALE